ncbi:hypothetical protein GvMRE_I2g9 [endosymbiont GvMRE of Glomus versiforme]|nr:hypothetical protein GvMRE_I2g9 [endosymbiont GvMRE of Glomus versiforme]
MSGWMMIGIIMGLATWVVGFIGESFFGEKWRKEKVNNHERI